MSKNYVLNDKREAVPCDDLKEWSRQFGDDEARRVGRTQVGPYLVSTVFLGIDHSFGHGAAPLLFETLAFGPDDSEDMDRCSTWAEAEAMHAAMVARYKERLS